MSPPDAVAAFEREHLPMRGWFSHALEWPTLAELLPQVSPGEIERLRGRFRDLHSAAKQLAFAAHRLGTNTDLAALADLRVGFPEFSDSTLRQALADEAWYAMW